MDNLTENERDALRAIDCSGDEESDLSKALTVMGFIYTLIAYFLIKGLHG